MAFRLIIDGEFPEPGAPGNRFGQWKDGSYDTIYATMDMLRDPEGLKAYVRVLQDFGREVGA